MAIVHNIPVSYSSQDGKESNSSEIALRADHAVKALREATSRENLSYIARRSRVGGSPSALRHMKEQRQRKYNVSIKNKERKLRKLKNK